MRARVGIGTAVTTLGLIGGMSVLPVTPASANSTHTCQGHNNCNGGGGSSGGGGGTTTTLECKNTAGGLIVVQANVCPADFPILVKVLSA